MRFLLAAACLAATFSTSNAATSKPDGGVSQTIGRPATEREIEMVREAMEERLLDAQSARFRNVLLIATSPTMDMVCGDVNSKNRMGAYVGYERFMGLSARNQAGAAVYHIMGYGPPAESVCADEIKAQQKKRQ